MLATKMMRLIVSANSPLEISPKTVTCPFDLFSCDFSKEIDKHARKYANRCHNMVSNSYREAYQKVAVVCTDMGVKPPEINDKVSLLGAITRTTTEHWWRRNLRSMLARELESREIKDNHVNRFKSIYVSKMGLDIHIEQIRRNRHLLESYLATNEEGQEYTLAELADLSVSNPKNRRNELMCRMAGFEQYADDQGHVGVFWTVTCPSRMHASFYASGKPNPKYDGTTPDQAQKYLCKDVWYLIRSKFKREGLTPYGFRVVEPQHDGTPHWHFLVFLPPEQVEQATEIVRHYALLEDGDEKGAVEHRFTVEKIDRSKGTATGYIAKYISKNLDGHGVDKDLYGIDMDDSTKRVRAWASTWHIRQFQQVGGPSVTPWREMRKIKKLMGEERAIEKAWIAAQISKWNMFVEAMGGHDCGRNQMVKLAKEWSDDHNQYGDPVGWETIGVKADGIVVSTRLHEWKIELAVADPESIEARSAGAPCATAQPHRRAEQREAPWSPINNCTLYIKDSLIKLPFPEF